LVVNRLLTDWIYPATREVGSPEVEIVPEADGTGPAKDFTSPLVTPRDPGGL
jgi:hypothetical protein